MGIFSILSIIGALGFFIYGMKVMSEGIQKAAGDKLRVILKAITSNRLSGIFTGFLTTSIIQSSSATTVMIVSFVNAGLLTLRQAIGVIMGANIGTTMTAWLLVLLGFSKFSLASYSLPVLAIGVPLLFVNKDQLKSLGEFLIGFALLFMGLSALKGEVKVLHLEENQAFIDFITGLGEGGYGAILLFVFIGTILTIIVQSSSAAMALTLIFVAEGLPLEFAAAIVLGENIGTTITANLAAMIGNVHSKRAARAHLLFNVFGVIWMLIVFFPFIHWVTAITEDVMNTLGISIKDEQDLNLRTLALFHTFFNIINTVMLVWFVKFIETTVIKFTPSKSEDDEVFKLEYIGSSVMLTPEMSILEAKKEVTKFGDITSRMIGFLRTAINTGDKKLKQKMYEKIAKYEEITDRVEIEISDYLGKASQEEMSEDAAMQMRAMLNVVTDLERIGDVFYQISKMLAKKQIDKVWFTPDQRDGLNKLIDLLEKAFKIMNTNLNMEYKNVSMEEAIEIEEQINKTRNKLRKKHLKNVGSEETNIAASLIYSTIFSLLERAGDHIINVSEAMTGEEIE
ncbi:MAG: Na/Pi cotransporter family protein [Flavobacteriales bacterium]|jgi:phosphate:Na+ symporter|nr:Na/Pi cotransporter family protein [Flavobacteriales bacterium]